MQKPLAATIGWSSNPEAIQAGREAAQAATSDGNPWGGRVAVVLASSWFEQNQLLKGLRSVLRDVPIIGGSTAGEILPDGPVSHHCVVLLVSSRERVASVGLGDNLEEAPREAGRRAACAATDAFRSSQRSGLLLFADGLTRNYADIMRGLKERLGTGFLIAGAMTGDDLRFMKTYQYANGRVFSGAVAGMLLGGSVKIGVGLEHGFLPMSKPRQVTRVRNNVLFQLDGRPAAEVYREYFGSEQIEETGKQRFARHNIAYPLGIESASGNQWLLRHVVSLGKDGGLSCTCEIPEGSWLQIMASDAELALQAVRNAAGRALRPLEHVVAALIFSSVSRRIFLGPEHAAGEIAAIRRVIGPSVPIAGCYTYGEQASINHGTSQSTSTAQTGSVLVVAMGT